MLNAGTPHIYVSLPYIPTWKNIGSTFIQTTTNPIHLKKDVYSSIAQFNKTKSYNTNLNQIGVPIHSLKKMLLRFSPDIY
jgi:hypothetical protein